MRKAKRVIRTTYVDGYDTQDAKEKGALDGRKIKFTKVKPNSLLKVTLNDNFRIIEGQAILSIQVDNSPVLSSTFLRREEE